MLGLAFLTVIASVGGGTWYAMSRDQAAAAAHPKRAAGIVPRVDRSANDDGNSSWSFWPFSSSDDTSADDTGTIAEVERPDPRAATLVSSFPCGGGMSASRTAVCTNWSLATMDHNLSLLIKSLAEKGTPPARLAAQQAAWQRQLNEADGDTEALKRLYQKRIEDLSRKL